jgi:hypothetical protein
MRFTVVIPCDNLKELWSHREDLIPAIVPEKIGRKDPVFAVRNFLCDS